MGMLLVARGPASEARIPVSEKSRGPWTLIATHPFSVWTLVGTAESRQTIDSSSSVRVTERKVLVCQTHKGISWSGDRRQTARMPGNMDSLNGNILPDASTYQT